MPLTDEERAALRAQRKKELLESNAGGDQALQQEQSKQSTTDILRKTARTTAETVDIGDHTMTQLRAQGETIDRVDRKMDEAEYNLKVSDRLVKGIGSVGGMVSTWFSRKPKVAPPKQEKKPGWLDSWMGKKKKPEFDELEDPRQKAQQDIRARHERDQKERLVAARNGEPVAKTTGPSNPGALTKEEEDLLDIISGDVGRMHQQANHTTEILGEQQKKLDSLSTKVDNVNDHMRKTTRNIKKITG